MAKTIDTVEVTWDVNGEQDGRRVISLPRKMSTNDAEVFAEKEVGHWDVWDVADFDNILGAYLKRPPVHTPHIPSHSAVQSDNCP